MSNAVINNHTKTYPVFEANQVLSADHLNDLRKYAESEIFSTRNQLIGVGIVHGLELNPSQNGQSISIGAGAGISTNGYLISAASEQSYRFVVPYQFQKEDDLSKIQILDALADNILREDDKTTRQVRNLQGNLVDLTVSFYELVADEDLRVTQGNDSQPLRNVRNGGEDGVALYLESLDNDIDSCFTTNCDERGIERHQTVRPLLIITNKDIEVHTPFQRPVILPIPRLRFNHSNAPGLIESFKVACADGMLTTLERAITKTDRYLTQQLGTENVTLSQGRLRDIKTVLLNTRPNYLPYFYELVRDVSQALTDLLDATEGIEELTKTLPRIFDQHLILGPVSLQSHAFPRTEFIPAPEEEDTSLWKTEIEFLWQRLHALILCFSPEAQGEIKITPGHTTTHDLQLQSMPFFYSQLNRLPLQKFWNLELHIDLRSNEVPSYFSNQYANARHLTHPLEYEHEGKDLLLVEDLIGTQKSTTVEALQALKKQHHLAFGVVALRVSSTDHDEPYPLPAMDDPLAITEDNFKTFIEENPGLYHGRGVRKDWTLVLVFEAEPDDTDGQIAAVLVLPYICCGKQQIAAPEPYILDAHDDEVTATANAATGIDALANDEFDPNSPYEVELIEEFTLDAVNETTTTVTDGVLDIDALDNDLYDPDSPIEVELLSELNANDVAADADANEATDIDVLSNDSVDPGDIELDFADQP